MLLLLLSYLRNEGECSASRIVEQLKSLLQKKGVKQGPEASPSASPSESPEDMMQDVLATLDEQHAYRFEETTQEEAGND